MFKKGSYTGSHFRKGDLAHIHKQLGNFHAKGSVYPMVNANDTDLNGSRKAGNSLERHHK